MSLQEFSLAPHGRRSLMVRSTAVCAVLLALSGCGYKGPLTLPEKKPVAAAPQSTAPVAGGEQAPARPAGR